MSVNPVKSALMSIADYSDSEDEEEDAEAPHQAHSSLGSLVESLRKNQADTDTKSETVTKIVRLDSGKVVKIQVSPTRRTEIRPEFEKQTTAGKLDSSPSEKFLKPDLEKKLESDNLKFEKVLEFNEKPASDISEVKQCVKTDETTFEIEKPPVEDADIAEPASFEETKKPVEVANPIVESQILKAHLLQIEAQVAESEDTEDTRKVSAHIEQTHAEKSEQPVSKEETKIETEGDNIRISVEPEPANTEAPPTVEPTENLEPQNTAVQQNISPIPEEEPNRQLIEKAASSETEKPPSSVEDSAIEMTKPKLSPELVIEKEVQEIRKLSPVVTISRISDDSKSVKVLPPIPNLEKIRIKPIPEPGKSQMSPIRIKRSYTEDNKDPIKLTLKKQPEGESQEYLKTNAEIRDILSRRLGSGLDISILPAEPGPRPFQMRPVSVDIPPVGKQMPGLLSPYQARQTYQASFQNTLKSPTSLQSVSPPSRKSLQKPDQPPVPGIVIRKIDPGPEGRLKVVPSAMNLPPALKTDPKPVLSLSEPSERAMSMMAHSFENLSKHSNPPGVIDLSQDSANSSGASESMKTFSRQNTGLLDFEDIIGSNILCKESSSGNNSQVASESQQIQQHLHQQPPPASTPRKRGRPRKVPPPIDPSPLVATWPPEGMDCFPAMGGGEGGTGGNDGGQAKATRTRRSRRDFGGEFEMLTPTKRRRRKRNEEGVLVETGVEGGGLLVQGGIKMEGGELLQEIKKEVGEEIGLGVKVEITDTPKQKRRRRKGPFYVKRKTAQTPKPKVEKENFQNFEEETRMSATEGGITPSTHERIVGGDESLSNSIITEGNSSVRATGNKKGRMEIATEGMKPITVQQLVEYSWPPLFACGPDEKPENYMIQEQISEFLGCKSFKRKYPSLKRRSVEMEERNYLQENGFVSESMCDMGLTALFAADVMEIMYEDFPNKYDEFRKYTREKKAREQKALRDKHAAERADMDPRQEAIESITSFNSDFNKMRRERRSAYFDMQTFTVHRPANKFASAKDLGPVGNYPLALISGQNTDYYKAYSSATLKYFPLNTVVYGPMRPNERQIPDEEMRASDDASDDDDDDDDDVSDDDTDSDDSTSSDDSSSSSSDDSQGSSSSGKSNSPPPIKSSGKTADNKTPRRRFFSNIKTQQDVCKDCNGNASINILITCYECKSKWHPACVGITSLTLKHVKLYNWQCVDCKSCNVCNQKSNPEQMVFCDYCDRGNHIFCIGLHGVPEGSFICALCKPKSFGNCLRGKLAGTEVFRNIEE